MMLGKINNFLKKNRLFTRQKKGSHKAQSLVEIALTLPLLLMLLSGLVEFGFMLNYYLSLVDSTREVARVYSNFDPIENVSTFYPGAVDGIILSLEPRLVTDTSRKIVFDAAEGDDIIISAYSVSGGTATLLPSTSGAEYHWSNNQSSKLNTSEVNSRLIATAPNTGLLVIEVFYSYDQVLGLPWLAMIPDPTILYAYTVMPLSSAEPTATPSP